MTPRPFTLGARVWTKYGLGEIVGRSEPFGTDWTWAFLTFTHGPWVVRVGNELQGFASDDLSWPEDVPHKAIPHVLMASPESVARLLRAIFGGKP